jgi:hypothetical protein
MKLKSGTPPNGHEIYHTPRQFRVIPVFATLFWPHYVFAQFWLLCFVMIWRNTVLKIYCLFITRIRLQVFVVSVKCKRSEIKWSEYVHGRKAPSFSISSLPAPCQLYFHVNLSQEVIKASFEQLGGN